MEQWIDLAIIIYLTVHFIGGTRKGFMFILISSASFIFSLVIAFFTYTQTANVLADILSINQAYANILGFFVNAIIFKNIIILLIHFILPKGMFLFDKSIINRAVGGIAAFAYGGIVIFLIFSIALSFSLPSFINEQLASSVAGKFIASDPIKINSGLKNVFGNILETTVENLEFFTIETEDKEKIELGFKTHDFKIEEELEKEIFELVNKERASRGLRELIIDDKAREAARKHAADMFQNGYFSHVNLEGKNATYRMRAAGANFTMSGENLALSKDLASAHEGLMNSPGHKKNILFPFFRKIGIGVMNGGKYGIMFVQDFTD